MPYLYLMLCHNVVERQQKMQFARLRRSGNIGKAADGGTRTLSKNQNNHKFCRKDPEVSAIILSNSDERYIILTWVTTDPRWKFFSPPIVLPLQGSDQRNCLGSGADAKMDGLEPVPSSPAISFDLDMQNAQRSHHLPDCTCCAKTFTASSSLTSNGLSQSQIRGSVNKRTKAVTISNSSSQQNGKLSNDSSGSGHDDGSVSTASADPVKDVAKVDKPVKRSSRKKVKKKGRQQKKSSCCSDTAVVCEQGIHGISALETCYSNSDSAFGDGCSSENNLYENAIPFDVSLQEIIMEKVDTEESGNDTVKYSTTSKATSYSDDVDVLERAACLHQDSTGDDFGSNHLGVGHRPLIVSTNTIKTTNISLSGFGGEFYDAHLKQTSTHDEITSGLLSDGYSTPILDSFSDGWNSDRGTNGSDDVSNEPPIGKENGKLPSERGVVLDCSNCGTSFHDVTSGKGTCGTSYDSNNGIANIDDHSCKVIVDANNNFNRTRCGSRDCTSSDGFSVISGKKVRQDRKSSVSSNGTHRLRCGVNVHGQAGKESNHSVRQKVQMTDIDKCICEPKDIDPVCLQFDALKEGSLFTRYDTFMGLMENEHEKSTKSTCIDEISARADVLKRSAITDADADADAYAFSLKSEHDSLRNKVTGKLKREHISRTKQKNSHNSRKGSHTSKAASVRPTEMNLPQKEALDISLLVNHCKSSSAGSRSSSCFPTDSFDCSSSEPLQYSQTRSEKTRSPGNVIALACDMNAQASQNQTNIMSTASDSLEQLEVESDSSSKFCKDKPGDTGLKTCDENGPAELETYITKVENSKSDHNCGSILQKLIPVGRKDAEALDNLSNSHRDDPFSDSWNLKRAEEEKLSSESHCHIPLTNAGVTCLGPNSGSVNYGSSEDEVTSELRYHATGIPKEHISMHIASSYLPIHKSNVHDISLTETDSHKILQAVNDAYRVQIESEGVQLATGSPLAEFERLLHSAAPVLDQTYSVQRCNACSGDQLIGDSLCGHQTPNLSLKSLWQWYEMPGSFGLEVKAEDYQNLKRFGSDHYRFRAYFAPFLSAVQLFGHCRSSVRASNVMPIAEFTKGSDMDTTSDYLSHFNHFPFSSVRLPWALREEETDSNLPANSFTTSDSSSASGQDGVCKQSVGSACLSDSELLFEYFESEQPQQRRTLFEKIKELVRGNATSNSQSFGDPLKLKCLHLRDLHPSSWYSVAWYPIYRIPDGNFRAAFLTYHSLGHFIHRSAASDSLGGVASIVSPVVGLQSYNTQGECWFQPRNSMAVQMEGSLHFNASEVLEERLRTLRQTAHVMATASVCKGDQKSMNRQPDYEFFLSRRR